MHHTFRAIGLVLAPLLVAGCASGPQAQPPESIAAQPASSTDYTLGPGDKVRITVYGEEKLTGEYSITSTGLIAFPLIGNIEAGDRTLHDIESTITTRLRGGYLKDPRVAIEVLNYRPFYILGEVNKPGEYPYTNGLTLQQAVATAGGYTYRANTHKIGIKRPNESTEHLIRISNSQPLQVRPGDTIRITERFF